MAWTWEWLSSFEEAPLAHAQQSLTRATELAPDRADAWSLLSALELARGQVDRAALAARRGRAAAPEAWEPVVAFACASYRAGALARADSAFRLARARVPDDLRRRFEAAVWTPNGGAAAILWRGNDPDLTTPENEAELDYLTRVGLAVILFRDAHGLRWDMRTELFLRYGPPDAVEVNPLSSPLALEADRHESELPPMFHKYAPEPLAYPYSVQAWSYPELGIRVIPPGVLAFGPKVAPGLATSNIFAVLMFALLAYSLYHFARKKLD